MVRLRYSSVSGYPVRALVTAFNLFRCTVEKVFSVRLVGQNDIHRQAPHFGFNLFRDLEA